MKALAISAPILLAAVAATALLGSGSPQEAPPTESAEYHWSLPKGFPRPVIPADNPMSETKVQLGRYLFYDQRVSGNGKQSCASCHRPELAFTDGLPRALGSTGQVHPRSSMTLVNVAYESVLSWSDPGQRTLKQQALTPMFNKQPVELGVTNNGADFLALAKLDPTYKKLFPGAFPEARDPFTLANFAKAIASFERTIIDGGSPYDRYHYGDDDNAVSASAKRGEILFFSEPLWCFRCHGGFNFTDATDRDGRARGDVPFHNTGLYNLAGALSYPSSNLGLYDHTAKAGDVGKFKTPTLRNIALTGPSMHDGSIPTLDAVLDHYAAGGRTVADGPDAGDGSHNPNRDPLVQGFKLSPQDRTDLIAFLNSLTDQAITRDPRFANPWPAKN